MLRLEACCEVSRQVGLSALAGSQDQDGGIVAEANINALQQPGAWDQKGHITL